MRRVVTGEELAQLYNPDPFAMPRWRSPVYRTPFGIILVAKFFKLLGWIVRLIARHPLAASVLVLSVVTWIDLGWVTLVALVLAAVVMLAAWRWFWPVSFSRWAARPARGKWRAWCYRRRWAAVMTIAGVAPWYQGRILLPVLGKVTATRYVDRVYVRLVSGQSAADFAKCAENLAHGFGALLCRVRTAKSGAVVLEFIRRDALAALVPALPIPANPDLKALPVGRREDGLPWLVKLHGTHVLIAGATGAGKASLLWGLVRAMFALMQVRPGPGAGRGPEADGAGLRPGHLRVLRRLCRRPGRHRRHARPSSGRHAGPGGAGSPGASASTPRPSRTRSRWCWSMRSRS